MFGTAFIIEVVSIMSRYRKRKKRRKVRKQKNMLFVKLILSIFLLISTSIVMALFLETFLIPTKLTINIDYLFNKIFYVVMKNFLHIIVTIVIVIFSIKLYTIYNDIKFVVVSLFNQLVRLLKKITTKKKVPRVRKKYLVYRVT